MLAFPVRWLVIIFRPCYKVTYGGTLCHLYTNNHNWGYYPNINFPNWEVTYTNHHCHTTSVKLSSSSICKRASSPSNNTVTAVQSSKSANTPIIQLSVITTLNILKENIILYFSVYSLRWELLNICESAKQFYVSNKTYDVWGNIIFITYNTFIFLHSDIQIYGSPLVTS